ncbi:hypothetical protein C8239_14800 [Paracidovorax avenae]|nr:hypothetical protein C8239_14800 [Paracidovorax avenae]
MALIQENGKFYLPGTSPTEVLGVFQMCEDLVAQLVPYSQRKLDEFGGDQNAAAKAIFQGLLAKRWCSVEQSIWVMLKTVHQLGWPVLENDFRN